MNHLKHDVLCVGNESEIFSFVKSCYNLPNYILYKQCGTVTIALSKADIKFPHRTIDL